MTFEKLIPKLVSQLPDPRLNLNGNVKTTLWRNYTRIILDLNVEDIVARRNFPQNYILDGSQDVHKTSKHLAILCVAAVWIVSVTLHVLSSATTSFMRSVSLCQINWVH